MRFKASWGTYFACLGLGFMFVEVAMIQKLTLLLGYPTRSLTVTLFSLLVSTGAGSYLSSRYAERWERAVGRLLASLVTLVAIWLFVVPHAVAAFVGFPLFLRALAAVALTAPFGLCLGGFLPIGMRAITGAAGQAPGAVAWAWAINAFFSVIGSILSAILAMMVGFKFLIIGAPVIYAVGVLALVGMAVPRASSDAA
jgi:MFS family permease